MSRGPSRVPSEGPKDHEASTATPSTARSSSDTRRSFDAVHGVRVSSEVPQPRSHPPTEGVRDDGGSQAQATSVTGESHNETRGSRVERASTPQPLQPNSGASQPERTYLQVPQEHSGSSIHERQAESGESHRARSSARSIQNRARLNTEEIPGSSSASDPGTSHTVAATLRVPQWQPHSSTERARKFPIANDSESGSSRRASPGGQRHRSRSPESLATPKTKQAPSQPQREPDRRSSEHGRSTSIPGGVSGQPGRQFQNASGTTPQASGKASETSGVLTKDNGTSGKGKRKVGGTSGLFTKDNGMSGEGKRKAGEASGVHAKDNGTSGKGKRKVDHNGGSSSGRNRAPTKDSGSSGKSDGTSEKPRDSPRRSADFSLSGTVTGEQVRIINKPFVDPNYLKQNPNYLKPRKSGILGLDRVFEHKDRATITPSSDPPTEHSQQHQHDVESDLEAGRMENQAKELSRRHGPAREVSRQPEQDASAFQPESSVAAQRRASAASQLSRISPNNTPAADRAPRPSQDSNSDGESMHGIISATEVAGSSVEDEGEQPVPADSEHGEEAADEPATTARTAWALFRAGEGLRVGMAELLGVMIQLTIGLTGDLAVTCANPQYANTADWSWGLGTMMAIYVAGGKSGAHLNPTITIMLWFFRGQEPRKIPYYFCAQFLGAFLACFIVYGVYYASIQEYIRLFGPTNIIESFVTSQRFPYILPVNAFFNEFTGTACLVVTVLALGDDTNTPPAAGMNAFVIGLVVTALATGFARQTGVALNPSRDFGPRLALVMLGYGKELFTNPYWFYGPWAGSLCGAFTGALFYDLLIFEGSESPVHFTPEKRREEVRKWAKRLYVTAFLRFLWKVAEILRIPRFMGWFVHWTKPFRRSLCGLAKRLLLCLQKYAPIPHTWIDDGPPDAEVVIRERGVRDQGVQTRGSQDRSAAQDPEVRDEGVQDQGAQESIEMDDELYE